MSSPKLQSVRGTQDFIGKEAYKFNYIIDVARKIAGLYGFEDIATPIFEFTEVFKRTLGEMSDVVNKEMYTFEDKGGESITLRPEFTAGIARAFTSNGLQQNLPLRLFSSGPVFRYERPQKGRFRQFHQINFEWLGGSGTASDVQTILLAIQVLDNLGILNKVRLDINTLGDRESRENYTEKLIKYLTEHKEKLSEDSRKRLEKNPLRILDSKDEGDRSIISNAPVMYDSLNKFSRDYFDEVVCEIKHMSAGVFNIRLEPNYKIVRGLDYYSHTVFEFVDISGGLGSQSTVMAGGRYDGLIKQMGGPETPAIGFAAGIERLMLMLPEGAVTYNHPVAVIAEDTVAARFLAVQLATKLRTRSADKEYKLDDCAVEIFVYNNLRKGLEKAHKIKASHAIIIGSNELEAKKLQLKNLNNSDQKSLSFDIQGDMKDLMRAIQLQSERTYKL